MNKALKLDMLSFVRNNKIQKNSKKFENLSLWTKCKECQYLTLKKDLKKTYGVCQQCNFHHYISTKERFEITFDNAEYALLPSVKTIDDPLHFTDTKSYKERIEEHRKKSQLNEAIQFAQGRIGNIDTLVGVMDFAFIGGSLSFFVGQSIVNAAEFALKQSLPIIIFTASGGARMQEGILSLMQMPRTILALKKLKQQKIPYINVLVHPTTGGVSASFAMIGDLTIAEPRSTIGLAGVRVIEQTLREKIPDNFQTSEFQFKHGFIDIIVNRMEMKAHLSKILNIFHKNGLRNK